MSNNGFTELAQNQQDILDTIEYLEMRVRFLHFQAFTAPLAVGIGYLVLLYCNLDTVWIVTFLIWGSARLWILHKTRNPKVIQYCHDFRRVMLRQEAFELVNFIEEKDPQCFSYIKSMCNKYCNTNYAVPKK